MIRSQAEQNDLRGRAAFPALYHFSLPRLTVEQFEGRFASSQCPSEQNNFAGISAGCYSNPAMDQILERLKGALEPEDQRAAYRDMIRLYTQELPLLPLVFPAGVILVREGITGVRGSSKPDGGIAWNIVEWDTE